METKEKRLKKALFAFPLLILPCLALGFFAMGGGKTKELPHETTSGISTKLPDAQFTGNDPTDKLSLYQSHPGKFADTLSSTFNAQKDQWQDPASTSDGAAKGEQRINEKLALISRQINQPDPPQLQANQSFSTGSGRSGGMKSDVDRLEQLMHRMQDEKSPDPEMTQLSAMLDKIMAIQNPADGKVKTKTDTAEKQNPFQAIAAVIDGNQKARQGGIVKLRLTDSLHLNGIIIPKGQQLFGSCQITNQRLLLDIKNIRVGNNILPVNFSVFSLDGMIGIDAPEAELAEAAGHGTGNALQNMDFLSMDQSIATQAAGAGITAAKGLLSKKAQRVRVRLRGGQPLLLRNNQLKSK